ncbi:MAG: isoprenyl transferase [Porphyromonas sp.]|nr:isoprenyl transferase [Porphyromonas sp.]
METTVLPHLDQERIPHHIAIIMDGNGRWAKQQGNDRTYGHKYGVESVRSVLKTATKLGVKVLTLYTFSEENWNRPQEEVEALMGLLVSAIHKELDELKQNNVRLEALGNIDALPEEPKAALYQAIEETKQLTGCRLVLAINYSGRTELVQAARRLAGKNADEITEQTLADHFYLPDLPDPDLLIRTGGEYRISNFLLWQLAYTELYFTPTYWPDFGEAELYQAIRDYQGRQRRFGLTGDQVVKGTK